MLPQAPSLAAPVLPQALSLAAPVLPQALAPANDRLFPNDRLLAKSDYCDDILMGFRIYLDLFGILLLENCTRELGCHWMSKRLEPRRALPRAFVVRSRESWENCGREENRKRLDDATQSDYPKPTHALAHSTYACDCPGGRRG